MNRVSTAGNYAISLANLTTSQSRQVELGRQVSSQKVAQDLKGYGNKAESLTAMRSVQSRIAGLLDQNAVLSDRYTTQDVALNQVADSAIGTRQAIADALASNSGDTLMQEISGQFSDAVQGLNTKSQGRYLFAGGQINTQPFTATSLSDLSAAASSTFFKNDRFVASNQIDETSSIQGGMLADDVGGALVGKFKEIQDFSTGGSGPFGGQLTDAQRTFLQSKLTELDTIHDNLVNTVAKNGTTSNRIDSATKDLTNRSNTLDGMVTKISSVDVAGAISKLQLAQFAVQAASQVFVTLRDSSLLNYLR